SSSLVRTKQIIIPANTYGNAHIQTGVDAEIGGKGNIPVMLQMDFDWVGPANSRIAMQGCRVSGAANAMAGPERVSIDLKTLSYVFPSGREINADIKGYVSDNIHGMYGVLGAYQWNASKVMPYAVVSGGFKGAADALKANSTTTIIGTTTTATVANQGDQFKQALYGGVGEGFGIMSDYVKSVLSETHPSVSCPNSQRVSVVLLDPVVMQVPESEFDYLTKGSPGSFQP
ncbi:MAG TPA: TrbI/VirB10 family protein, partial [Planctomycetota bacterium]|nr:TrbI/VirB10 family protein [Planctomycetota bacterium]